MIENIAQELNNALGADFVVFFENTPYNITDGGKEEMRDKGICLFKTVSGSVMPLQGTEGMQGQAVLQIALPTEDIQLRQRLQYKVDEVIQSLNGVPKIIPTTAYDYVLMFDVPRVVGNMDDIYGNIRQVNEMAVKFTVSAELQFGDNFTLQIDGQRLDGILMWNVDSTNAQFPRLSMNRYAIQGVQQYNEYKLSCQAYIKNTAIWRQLQDEADAQSRVTHVVRFSLNGKVKTFTGVLERLQLTGTKGQFQVANIVLALTYTGKVSAVFNANGGYWQETTEAYISYYSNGGIGSIVDNNSPYPIGTVVTILPNSATKAGYVFTSWNTEADGSGTTFLPGATTALYSNLPLYAQWSVAGYTVTYNINGGTGSIPTDTTQYQAGNVAVVLFEPTPTKTGYDFTGWSQSAMADTATYTESGTTTLTVNSNVILYAVYSSKMTITFNANGGYWTTGGKAINTISLEKSGTTITGIATNAVTSAIAVTINYLNGDTTQTMTAMLYFQIGATTASVNAASNMYVNSITVAPSSDGTYDYVEVDNRDTWHG